MRGRDERGEGKMEGKMRERWRSGGGGRGTRTACSMVWIQKQYGISGATMVHMELEHLEPWARCEPCCYGKRPSDATNICPITVLISCKEPGRHLTCYWDEDAKVDGLKHRQID